MGKLLKNYNEAKLDKIYYIEWKDDGPLGLQRIIIREIDKFGGWLIYSTPKYPTEEWFEQLHKFEYKWRLWRLKPAPKERQEAPWKDNIKICPCCGQEIRRKMNGKSY